MHLLLRMFRYTLKLQKTMKIYLITKSSHYIGINFRKSALFNIYGMTYDCSYVVYDDRIRYIRTTTIQNGKIETDYLEGTSVSSLTDNGKTVKIIK